MIITPRPLVLDGFIDKLRSRRAWFSLIDGDILVAESLEDGQELWLKMEAGLGASVVKNEYSDSESTVLAFFPHTKIPKILLTAHLYIST